MQYTVDQSHSEVGFSVRHMGITSVKGSFTQFQGKIEMDGGALKGMEADIDAASIHTRDAQRDQHLRSADFFDVDNHPRLIFKSTKVEALGQNRYRVTGDLTMRGVTKPVVLNVETTPETKDPWGKNRIGFSATGELDRKEWGLRWNTILEAGGLLVGDRVQILIEGEAIAEG